MSVFQKVYDWIDSFRTPRWLRDLFAEVQTIIVQTVYGIAKEYISQIEAKIIEVNDLNIGNSEKFKRVSDFAKSLGFAFTDSVLNVLLNALVLRLKQNKAI